MSPHRKVKNRNAFRPDVSDSSLEQRTVLNSTFPDLSGLLGSLPTVTPPSLVAPSRQTGTGMNRAQVRQAFNRELKNGIQDLQTFVNSTAADLYANGPRLPLRSVISEIRCAVP